MRRWYDSWLIPLALALVAIAMFVWIAHHDSEPIADPELGAVVSTAGAKAVVTGNRVAISTAYSTQGG